MILDIAAIPGKYRRLNAMFKVISLFNFLVKKNKKIKSMPAALIWGCSEKFFIRNIDALHTPDAGQKDKANLNFFNDWEIRISYSMKKNKSHAAEPVFQFLVGKH